MPGVVFCLPTASLPSRDTEQMSALAGVRLWLWAKPKAESQAPTQPINYLGLAAKFDMAMMGFHPANVRSLLRAAMTHEAQRQPPFGAIREIRKCNCKHWTTKQSPRCPNLGRLNLCLGHSLIGNRHAHKLVTKPHMVKRPRFEIQDIVKSHGARYI